MFVVNCDIFVNSKIIMSENFDLKIKKYFYMEKCIGNGTFSTVFQVRHVQNGQRFALKKIFIKDIQVELAKIDYYNEVQLLKVCLYIFVFIYVFVIYIIKRCWS